MTTAEGVTWDLSVFYDGLEDARIDEDLAKADELADQIVNSYKQKIPAASAQELFELFTKYEEYLEQIYRPWYYAQLRFNQNNLDADVQTFLSRVEKRFTEANNKLVFIDLEMNQIEDNRFAELLADDVLAEYRHYCELVRLKKPYQLTEEGEQVLKKKALTSQKAWTKFYDEFTASLEFEIEIDGDDGEKKKKTLTGPEMRNLFTDPDRALREQVFKTYYAAYEQHRLVLKNIFNSTFADHTSTEELRGYEEPMVPAFIRDQFPPDERKVIKILMQVTRDNYSLLQDYFRLKAKILGHKMKGWDIVAPFPAPEKIYDWETGKEMVLDAYQAFSPEMRDAAQKFFENGWVDAEVRKGKSSGAACWPGTTRLPQYFWLSYEGKLNNVATLAHEMGHGIHGYLAGHSQNIFNKQCPKVLAETASVFCEMLLTNKLMKELKDKEEKKKLLMDQLDDFHTTVFRQVLYTLWELEAHEKGKEGAVSDEDLKKAWVKHTTEAYDDAVEFPPVMDWAFLAIPHFLWYLYYCYSYSFGYLFVVSLYNKYLKEGESFVPKYLDLLRAGGRDFPVKMAKSLDIDLTSEAFWQGGFDFFKRILEELRSLVEE
ncbi:MAG: M3 family oligoendopeptidase [Candidatus Thorarchaeota archaeon]